MKKIGIALTAIVLFLAISGNVWSEITPEEKFEINEIVGKYLPGHQVAFAECLKGTHVVVGDIWEGVYYEFYILSPEYNAIGDGWSRPGYKKQAEVIKEDVLRFLNRSAQEALK